MSAYSVFVSYSRDDREVVKPFVELLRIADARVFRDEDCIVPGKKWKLVISEVIASAKAIVVFWTKNSAQSKEVGNELELGIKLKKDVVPVLLDNTPLAQELRAYQWVDFRGLFQSAYAQAVSRTQGRLQVRPPHAPQFYRVLHDVLMQTELKQSVVQRFAERLSKEM
jgi:hypothetical protein